MSLLLDIVKRNVSVSPSDAFYKKADINPKVVDELKRLIDGVCFESDEPGGEKSLRSFEEIEAAIDEL